MVLNFPDLSSLVLNPSGDSLSLTGGGTRAGSAASLGLVALLETENELDVSVKGNSKTYECARLSGSAVFEVEPLSESSGNRRIRLRESSLAVGQVCLVLTSDDAISTWISSTAITSKAILRTVVEIGSADDDGFADIVFDTAIPNVADSELDVLLPRFKATANRLTNAPVEVGFPVSAVNLDGVYSGILQGDLVILSVGDERVVRGVRSVEVKFDMKQGVPVQVPYTRLVIYGLLPLEWNGSPDVTVHFGFVGAGRLHRRRSPIVPSSVLTGTGIVAASTGSAPFDLTEAFVLVDADGRAVEATGEEIAGQATQILLKVDPAKLGSVTELRVPIAAYTNLSTATCGETIRNEILGNGDAATPFQTFTLAKKPLTYLTDASGRHNTLEVYVNGVKWRQAPSFYGARPSDQIYVVTHDDDHETIITFGDGELGSRLPTGVNNVVANYRFGVGGNAPANTITTLKKPIKGVRKVFNPLPAAGGKEPPTAEEIRREAPLSTLVLGRLVSLADFEAETRRFGNVLSAKATWGWDEVGENPVVKIWFVVPDAGDPSDNLRAYLAGMAEPNTQLEVSKAIADTKALHIELEVDPRYIPADVELVVAQRLFHPYDGVLSRRNAAIGGRLHRSRLHAEIHAVEGVIGIKGLVINVTEAMPKVLTAAEGHYLDFESVDMTIGNTAAGQILFANK